MSSIPAIISYLEFGRSELLKSVEGLSWRERTQLPVYSGWTIKDILAHMIGWDEWVINILPLIIQNRADEVAGINVDEYNRATVETWRDKSLAEVQTALQATHHQIIEMISVLNHVQIDMRRERQGRIITIRNYIIEMMVEHACQHASEIGQWRVRLDESIDPAALAADLSKNRVRLLAAIEGLSGSDVLTPNAVGVWSVKDVIGHLADWEQLILNAARHILDPDEPATITLHHGDAANALMVSQRAGQPWSEALADLTQSRREMLDFIAALPAEAWKQRGAFPWSDQGTLADLIGGAGWHDAEHAADVEKWRKTMKQ